MFLSNFVMNLFTLLILISSAVGQNQPNGNFSFDAPLIGEQNLPLVATLDFSKIDTELKSYISNTVYRVTGEKDDIDNQQEIDKRIKEALPQITDAITENIRTDLRESPSFTASLTTSIVPADTIIFDKVWFNTGNGYDKHTGVFTAPRYGRYHFSATVMSSGKQGTVHCAMKKNNIAHLNIFGGENFSAGTVNCVLALQKGDHVTIVRNSGQGVFGGHWSVFSGYFIGE
ncbi:heavy metal-binding protein HIP-like [Mytilus trossulus]|uniref:heavy metal-binding protein HIP-like n=1 Tax=Mytilus trossulus TaxID=6551 RepID=UPI003006E9F0